MNKMDFVHCFLFRPTHIEFIGSGQREKSSKKPDQLKNRPRMGDRLEEENEMSRNTEKVAENLELHQAPLAARIITGVVMIAVAVPVIGYIVQAMTTYTAI